jgi:hypothetical protein
MRGLLITLTLGCLSGAALAHAAARPLAQSADEVIARNVAARGGLAAWQKVDTLVYLGHIERASARESPRVPFVMQMQRPNMTRFEVKEQFSQYTRIFDGRHGWRIRPGVDGRPQTTNFSPAEVAFARTEYVVDTPLIDYRSKGVTAELDGIDRLEDGRKAYRLSLRLPDGAQRKAWVDVKTDLDVRYDRPATSPYAPGKPVSVYYGDFRPEGGLQVPHSIETTAEAGHSVEQAADKLIVERVMVNPKLDAMAFTPPARPLRQGNGGALVRIPGPVPGGGQNP